VFDKDVHSAEHWIIFVDIFMIETPIPPRSHDRLTAFLKAFGLNAQTCASEPDAMALFVVGEERLRPSHIVLRCRGGIPAGGEGFVLATAWIGFGGTTNPLVGALPDELKIALHDQPQLQGLAELFVAEDTVPHCGGAAVRDRLCEVIVVLAVRQAIASGTVNAGLLAGLAHDTLCPSLIAMHESPDRPWRIEDLAQIAGLSRSRYTAMFMRVVGTTPAAYLTSWRLAVGHTYLRSGKSVKAVAADVGFGSQEAFSRSFSRRYGCPPSSVKSAAA